jgi:hypothetical protein
MLPLGKLIAQVNALVPLSLAQRFSAVNFSGTSQSETV